MKIMYQTMAIVSVALVLTTGCVNPNGTQNNTGTSALIGGAVGAITGAAIGGPRNRGAGAVVGAAAGAVGGGLIGNIIDREQRQRLQQQSPQTWEKIQNNDPVYASSPPASTPPTATAPAPSAPPAATAPPASTPPTITASPIQQITVDDIKALTVAGVNTNAITHEIDISHSKYSPQDITTAQQANPPIDPTVIAYMQNHPSSS
jgi:hypothetical protein